MARSSNKEKDVHLHYDSAAANYHEQYEREQLFNMDRPYPANYFRLQLLVNSFLRRGVKRIIEVGVGEGTPLLTLGKAGIETWGFDISHEMVKKAKSTVQSGGIDPDQIFWGDIQDPLTYLHALKGGLFDGLMAMGVMPHVENDHQVLENMGTMVRPGGSVFVEFRNKLFSMFTFNRYTRDFILDDLLAGVGSEVKDLVAKDLEKRLRMDMPPVREKHEDTDAPGFDSILSKFHNPFEIMELFSQHGFEDMKFLWYHYHPAMPYLEGLAPEAIRKESFKLEHDPTNWRGFFLCSAFVVEAVKRKE